MESGRGPGLRVAVVGAGFAGLAAADAIARAGAEPLVLEARDRIGGRVDSVTLPNGAVIERGAEFVLPGYTALREEVARFGLGFWDKGMRYGIREPRGVEVPAGAMESAVEEIERALREGEGEGASVAGLLSRLEVDPGAREAILARAEVSAAAPAELVPAVELGLLARVGGEPAPTIAGGNGRLAECLAGELPDGTLRLGAPVRSIRSTPQGLVVATDDGSVEADACVVAVPQPLVAEIEFEPALPEEVAAVLGELEFGQAAKLFVPLARAAPPSATLAVPDRYWAWTATGERDEPQPVLCAFTGSAPALEGLRIADGPEEWLRRLGELRPDLALEPSGALLADWVSDPWARGAYSVETPEAALDLLSRPFGPDRRIALAGEHLGGEMSGLMEGALRSGRRAAELLLGSRS